MTSVGSRSQPLADDRVAYPLTEPWDGRLPVKAGELIVEPCSVPFARALNEAWHSRLPQTQRSPWKHAFHASFAGRTYGVALWHNPSARMLPSHWIELRRLAVAPDAPHCAASRMLGQMTRWLRREHPEYERAISYQDEAVHEGTIYRAAGWTVGARQAPRARDRSTARPGGRLYRWDQNGVDPAAAGKTRWEVSVAR